MAAPGIVVENRSLLSMTSLRIGGPARWFANPETVDETLDALVFAARRKARIHILGGGTNLLVADMGVDGLVVRLGSGGVFGSIEQDGDDPLTWRAGAAASLPRLVAETLRRGISGLEPFAGIPGSVGGAAAMNAGGADLGIGTFVRSVAAIDFDGRVRLSGVDDSTFGYRRSSLGGSLVTMIEFHFATRDDPGRLLEKARRLREKKAEGQPLDLPNAGCIFKNPVGASSGRLLDEAGCKGMREGGAEVSVRHANFIVNRGGATARDVAVLAANMFRRVRGRFGVALEPEVKCWGFDMREYFD